MALEDKHLDILQNIEFAIIQSYKNYPTTMKDKNAIKALEALELHYRALISKREIPDLSTLNPIEHEVYTGVLEILKIRQREISQTEAPRKRFSRVFKEPTQDEIFLACIRKLIKSSKRWNKRNGERGYIDFIKNYV